MQLSSQRLILEPLAIPHAEKLHQGLSDLALYKFVPNDPLSLDALAERYGRILCGNRGDNIALWRNWAVRLAGGEYIGIVETSVYPGDYAYLAYFMFAPHQRQGFAHEACAIVLAHVHQTYAVKRVVAEMDVRNAASWRLVESLGFMRTGIRLNADFFKGESSDEYHYELTF